MILAGIFLVMIPAWYGLWNAVGGGEQPTEPNPRVFESQPVQLKKTRPKIRFVDPAMMKSIRIYCMVPTFYADHRMKLLEVIASTWGPRCDTIKFFIDPAKEGESFPTHFVSKQGVKIDMVQVKIKRLNDEIVTGLNGYAKKKCTHHNKVIPCRHIWEKVWRSWLWVFQNDLHLGDYFLKVDDDSFIFPEFIKKFIAERSYDPDEPLYFGHVSFLSPVPFVNGAMVGLSRGSLNLVVPRYLSMPKEYGDRINFKSHRCVDRDGATQEITESICLNEVGVEATSMVDPVGKQMVALFRVSDSMVMRKKVGTTSWYWKGKDKENVCCSFTPAVFHWYKNTDALMRLNSYLYNETDTYLEDYYFSRTFMDELERAPEGKSMIAPIYQERVKMSRYLFFREIEYLWHVRKEIEKYTKY